ncbi:MAG TPA: alpha/beta fold hydrolase [Planctomycetota bacterium]
MARDLDSHPPERLFLAGPAGRLGATFEMPAAAPRGAVLHLHPHPLGGGTRRNNVVRRGALGSLEAGCAALRFDFRGAGESDGAHDEGRGEIDDAAAALAWLAERVPGVPVFVWGFSFGSRVALDLARRRLAQAARPALAGYLGVAWPTASYAPPRSGPWPEPMAFLAGDQDEYVDMPALRALAENSNAALTVVAGAEHFFRAELDRVRAFTAGTLRVWLDAARAPDGAEAGKSGPASHDRK